MTPAVNYLGALLLMLAGASIRTRALKQGFLLAASYLFYAAWGTGFLTILVASSVLNFGLGALLRRKPTLGRLWLGIIVNIALLGFLKYLPALSSDASFFHRILMPAGMSFWTFQALSYLFDLYQEEEIDASLLEFCLYLSFWPTVLMGPVCRLPKMLPQFREVHGLSLENLVAGLHRIGIGLFMKLILAQFLGSALGAALEVAGGFEKAGHAWGGLDVWFMAIAFGFQLFFDFSGYSHIVIGAALLFGFKIEENFDSPYWSSTPSVFWTKWHMSLSSWIRDYVFIPSATLRHEPLWRYFALLSSMVLFGLWHGATVTFLLWGTYHGIFLILHRLGQQFQRRSGISMDGAAGTFLSWAVTFFGISLGWVLFRTSDLQQALAMFRAVLSPASYAQLLLPADCYRAVLVLVSGYFVYGGLTSGDWVSRKGEELLKGGAGDPGAARRILAFSWENRRWWLTPMAVTVVVFAGLIVLFQNSRVTPFVYTLF